MGDIYIDGHTPAQYTPVGTGVSSINGVVNDILLKSPDSSINISTSGQSIDISTNVIIPSGVPIITLATPEFITLANNGKTNGGLNYGPGTTGTTTGGLYEAWDKATNGGVQSGAIMVAAGTVYLDAPVDFIMPTQGADSPTDFYMVSMGRSWYGQGPTSTGGTVITPSYTTDQTVPMVIFSMGTSTPANNNVCIHIDGVTFQDTGYSQGVLAFLSTLTELCNVTVFGPTNGNFLIALLGSANANYWHNVSTNGAMNSTSGITFNSTTTQAACVIIGYNPGITIWGQMAYAKPEVQAFGGNFSFTASGTTGAGVYIENSRWFMFVGQHITSNNENGWAFDLYNPFTDTYQFGVIIPHALETVGALRCQNPSAISPVSLVWIGPQAEANSTISVSGVNFKTIVPTHVPGAAPSSITVPASGSAYTNNNNDEFMVYIGGGTVTQIALNGTDTNMTSGSFLLGPGDSIVITYTTAPTMIRL